MALFASSRKQGSPPWRGRLMCAATMLLMLSLIIGASRQASAVASIQVTANGSTVQAFTMVGNPISFEVTGLVANSPFDIAIYPSQGCAGLPSGIAPNTADANGEYAGVFGAATVPVTIWFNATDGNRTSNCLELNWVAPPPDLELTSNGSVGPIEVPLSTNVPLYASGAPANTQIALLFFFDSSCQSSTGSASTLSDANGEADFGTVGLDSPATRSY